MRGLLGILWFVYIGLCCHDVFAQEIREIRGRANDPQGKSLPFLNVMIKEEPDGPTVAFSIADSTGYFVVRFESPADSIYLKLSGQTIEDTLILLPNRSQYQAVVLKHQVHMLKEFVIEGSVPIRKNGDTIRYEISNFQKEQDRTLADVLERMPGLTVRADGVIEYQGKPIEKFYIEGLDLLEGRYSLASNNLPAQSVKSVEVLENHQPVRVLDDIVHSDRASLNIRLWKGITTTGQGEGSGGFMDDKGLYKGNLTPMLFGGNMQAIVSWQSNNTGEELGKQIRVLTKETILEESLLSDEYQWVGIKKLNRPAFDNQRILFNNSHLGTINLLQKLDNEYQAKAYISYHNHRNREQGSTETLYLQANDATRVFESTSNSYDAEPVEGQLSIVKNNRETYFKNTFQFNLRQNRQNGATAFTEQDFVQTARFPSKDLYNHLVSLRRLGKQLVTLRSQVAWQTSNQSLFIRPGLVFPGGEVPAPQTMLQSVYEEKLTARHSAAYGRRVSKFHLDGKLGFDYAYKTLSGKLQADHNDASESIEGYENDQKLFHSSVYHEGRLMLNGKKLKLQASFPLLYEQVAVRNEHINTQQRTSRLFFNPALTVTWQLNGFWEGSLRAGKQEQFHPDRVHSNSILRNYRWTEGYAGIIPRQVSYSINALIRYRNSLTAFFFHSHYWYWNRQNNALARSTVSPSGILVTATESRDNQTEMHQLNGQVSKFLEAVNSTVRLEYLLQQTSGYQIINDRLSSVTSQTVTITPGIEASIDKYVNMTFKGSFHRLNLLIDNRQANRIDQLTQNASVYFFATQKQWVSVTFEYYTNWFENRRIRQSFLDLNYRYSFTKPRMDVYFSLENILNESAFVDFNESTFTISRITYQLRPRQFLMGMAFRF